MEPPFLRVAVHLRPDVVRPVQHPARLEAQRAATQREAVRPLAAPPRARLEQLHRVVIPREPNRRAAAGRRARVRLDPARAVLRLLWRGHAGPQRRGRICAPATAARGRVAPREELALEPRKRAEQERVAIGYRVGDRVRRVGRGLLRAGLLRGSRRGSRHERIRLPPQTLHGDHGERRGARLRVLVREHGAHASVESPREILALRRHRARGRVAAQQLSGRRAVLLFLKRPREQFVRVHRERGDAARALGELNARAR